MTPLLLAARYGRLILVIGLVAGITLPALGEAMRGWLYLLIALLLFLTMVRVGAQKVTITRSEVFKLTNATLIFQVFLPLLFIALFTVLSIGETALAVALILMASAPSISGSANLALMIGSNPAPALKLLLVGTVSLPLTVLPIFYLLPEFGALEAVFFSSAKLVLVIGGAALAAFLVHRVFPGIREENAVKAIDGCSSLTMAVLVIGLMSDVGPAILTRPVEFLGWFLAAFAASFGLQLLAFHTLKHRMAADELIPFSIVAGCRNNALLLVALPSDVLSQILLFVGCYQIPMYLTPLLLSRLYRTKA